MNWYRRYNGTFRDEKLGYAAREIGEPRAVVLAVWDVLLELASESSERGRVAGFRGRAAGFTVRR